MADTLSWQMLHDIYIADSRAFDRKAKEARAAVKVAKRDKRFLEANNSRVIAQEMRQKAVDARTFAAGIKNTHLTPAEPPQPK